jgi:hypothetical protein
MSTEPPPSPMPIEDDIRELAALLAEGILRSRKQQSSEAFSATATDSIAESTGSIVEMP